MTQKLYAVYDTKASYYMTPWPCRNIGIARREFASACLKRDSALGQFPADYVLYEIGVYNDNDATIESIIPPTRICDGVEVLQMAVGEVSK